MRTTYKKNYKISLKIVIWLIDLSLIERKSLMKINNLDEGGIMDIDRNKL